MEAHLEKGIVVICVSVSILNAWCSGRIKVHVNHFSPSL